MNLARTITSAIAATLALVATSALPAQVQLIANGTLTGSSAGYYADLSGLPGNLENGVPANLLGGLGSGLAFCTGDFFLALPDRGPNAVPFNSLIDDTASYIDRYHVVKMNLTKNTGTTGLPFTISPVLAKTLLVNSLTPLVYGSGSGLNVGSGAPGLNRPYQYYFTGRSDNFDANQNSGDSNDARLDPESIRISPDGLFVYISDEYGPYIHQLFSLTGTRLRTYKLPAKYYVSNLSPVGANEIANNTSYRVANKGMEGLALTPDGKTLVGIMQNSLIQDAALGGNAAKMLRIISIDAASGTIKGEYAYLLTTGSGVSDLVALNDHEFIVDERDGNGLGDGSKAKVKQFFKIDLNTATDVSNMNGTQAAANAVNKTLFVDLVNVLTAGGFTASTIPAKIEGLAFGEDVVNNGVTTHTLWVANDNDFLQDYSGPNTNPNQFFVVGFTDADLAGSTYNPGKLIYTPEQLMQIEGIVARTGL